MPTRRAVAAALTAVSLAALPGCACGFWREDSERSLAMARQAFVGRLQDDAAQTRRNFAGIDDWFAEDVRRSSHNLRTTYDLYTDCPETPPPAAR